MKIPILHQLVVFIEEIFKHDAPIVAEAAAGAALETAETDPKIAAIAAASVALLQAAQNVKAAINTPPAEPPAS